MSKTKINAKAIKANRKRIFKIDKINRRKLAKKV